MLFHGPFEGGWIQRNRLQALEGVLEVLLREELREVRGGVYGVGVSAGSSVLPTEEYTFSINFTCDPERAEELQQAALAIVASVRDQGIDDELIAQEQEKNRRDREVRITDNGFWAGGIAGSLRRGDDPQDLLTYDERNDALSAAAVQDMAAELLVPSRMAILVMQPQNQAVE
jgi:zinc protease